MTLAHVIILTYPRLFSVPFLFRTLASWLGLNCECSKTLTLFNSEFYGSRNSFCLSHHAPVCQSLHCSYRKVSLALCHPWNLQDSPLVIPDRRALQRLVDLSASTAYVLVQTGGGGIVGEPVCLIGHVRYRHLTRCPLGLPSLTVDALWDCPCPVVLEYFLSLYF